MEQGIMATMISSPERDGLQMEKKPTSWSAVLAVALSAFVLVSSEFMPVSLLTPISLDLGVSEGHAGQAISISGAFALLTSLFVSPLTARLDRKYLLLSLTLLMMISGSVVAFAPNYLVFMVGRALIGVAIGGFWSMSAAIAMRLVPDADVPRALAMVNGGSALAMVVATPMGSSLGALIGWRYTFFCIVPIAAIALCWKFISLPSLRVADNQRPGGLFRIMKQRPVQLGLIASGLFFMGDFSLFTYLRPFLETVTHVSVPVLSLVLLLMGVMGFIGTSFIGRFLTGDGLYRTLIVIPVIMAGIALALVGIGTSLPVVAVLLCVWGLVGTSAPVGWWTWIARTMPHDAEIGGGLIVAIVQLSIMLGATIGGILFDQFGYQATFILTSLMLLVATYFTVIASRENN